MPAFEGLYDDPYDGKIQDMLFELAMFYSFARLTLHSETTLAAFDQAVGTLGKAMRVFAYSVCTHFQTRELPRETESRQRRRKTAHALPGAKLKTFNLNTYKYHRLSDYPRTIRELGTMDNYSTQTVHLHSKSVW